MSNDVEVRASNINGDGLFALRRFKAGEVVLRWKLDKKINKAQIAAVSPNEQKYLHPLDNETFVVIQPPERFVNHSCNSNTVARHFCDVAIRDIVAGEEITSDYSIDGGGQSFPCSCGATNCKKVIGENSQSKQDNN